MARIAVYVLALTMSVTITGDGSAADASLPKGFQRIQGSYLVPQRPFVDEKGITITIAAFKGKIVVVNFWATWCGPCIKEMPSLERLAARLPADKFAVIAINQDKGGAAVAKPFLKRIGVLRLPIYAEPNEHLSRDLSVRGLPTTVVVGRGGNLIGRLEGAAEWDGESVVAYLLSLSDR